MKAIGSAVLTALQAQNKSIEEVAELVNKRRSKANFRGITTAEWITSFWTAMGLIEVERIKESRK